MNLCQLATAICTFFALHSSIFFFFPLIFPSGQVDEALQEGVDALRLLLSEGLDESAKRFNKEQKYKHLRVQTLPV